LRKPNLWMILGAALVSLLGVVTDTAALIELWQKLSAWADKELPPASRPVQGTLLVFLFLLGGVILVRYSRWKAEKAYTEGTSLSERELREEQRVRSEYLALLSKGIEEQIKTSIHQVRRIDLGLAEDRDAVVPWHYVSHDPHGEIQNFSSFEKAYDHFGRRLLLLGAPGSGKSTTLLLVAQRLIEEARQRPEAPIPVHLNLSSFSQEDVSEGAWHRLLRRFPALRTGRDRREEHSLEHWLVKQLARRAPGRDVIAARWVTEGRVALLLDGLDEVDEEEQPRLMEALNVSLRQRHFDVPIVLCSRLLEYQRLTDNRAERLRLNGAVVLQPLDPGQIDSFLNEARATGLREALAGDEQLHELAKTPLTLSMMTLAYGDLSPTEIPAGLSLTAQRSHLFDVYIDRMMQRHARRQVGKLFDLNPAREEPTGYLRARVDRYLGWLAGRLSERMQTSFALEEITLLLQPIEGPRARESERIPFWNDFLRSRLLGVFVLSLGLAIAFSAFRGLGGGAAVGWPLALGAFAGPLLLLLLCLVGGWKESIGGLLVFGIGTLFWMLVYSLLIPPVAGHLSCSTALAGCVMIILPGMLINLLFLRSLLLGSLCGGLACLLALVANRSDLLGWALFFGALTGQALTWMSEEFDREAIIGLSILAGLAVGIGELGIRLFGQPDATQATVLVSTLFCSLAWLGAAAGAIGCVLGALPGIAMGSSTLAAAGSLGGAFLSALLLNKSNPVIARKLWAPFARAVLAGRRLFPWRMRTFLAYGVETFLLKRAGQGYEFYHRLLRDHFANQSLRPLLLGAHRRIQLSDVRSLARHGEASLEILRELAGHSDPLVREASVVTLIGLPTPHVVPVLREWLVREQDAVIRRGIVKNLARLSLQERVILLEGARSDPDPEVRQAVVEVATAFRGGAAILILQHALADDDAQVQRAALVALARYPVPFDQVDWAGHGHRVVAELLAFLTDRSSEVRAAAVRLLAFLGDEQSGQNSHLLLAEALADRTSSVRLEASESLAARKALTSSERLLLQECQAEIWSYLDSGRLADRRAASVALCTLIDPDLALLVERSPGSAGGAMDPHELGALLGSRHFGIAIDAARLLTRVDASSLQQQLLTWLTEGTGPQQIGSALALGALHTPEAASALRALAERPEEKPQSSRSLQLGAVSVQEVATVALLGFEWPSPETLHRWRDLPWPIVRKVAEIMLPASGPTIGESAGQRLRAVLRLQTPPQRHRSGATEHTARWERAFLYYASTLLDPPGEWSTAPDLR